MDAILFLASKVLWGLMRPGTLLVFVLVLGWLALLARRLRLATWILSIAMLATLVLTFLPVGYLALRPLEGRFPVAPPVEAVQGIIILGGGEDLHPARIWGGRQINGAAERYTEALLLAEAYPEAMVLFSGGRPGPEGTPLREAETPAGLLLRLGLDEARLILESGSRNTHDNAVLGRALVPETLDGTWLLVTSAFHMPRAYGTFCSAGWRNLVPWPTDFRSGHFRREIGPDFADHLEDLNTAVKEYIGIHAYRWMGRIDPLDQANCGP